MIYRSEFPVFAVTADLVILTLREQELCVLLVRRGVDPYAGMLALPGGFVQENEDLFDAAYRELAEETGIDPGLVTGLEQFRTYGTPGRDPRPERVVSVAWVMLGANLPDPVAGSDAAEALWVPVSDLCDQELAFDHAQILADGLEHARSGLEHSALATAFVGPEFTVSELRGVYEAVWGERLDPANFQRKVTGAKDFLIPVKGQLSLGRGRPARVYRAGPATVLHPPLRRA